jgi:capsular polysaccharide biosynthesis protein
VAYVDDRTGPMTFADLVRWFWLNKLTILIGGIIIAAVGFGYALLASPMYKATVALLPQAEDSNLGLMNQVEMISGINLDGGGTNEELYGKIIGSTTMLDSLLGRTWTHTGHDDPVDLYAVFKVDVSEKGARHKIHRILRNKVIRFSRDRQNGYMELSVTAPHDPVFAADLANAVVDNLDQFNKSTLHMRAREHRIYVESREAIAAEKLRNKEDELAEFVNDNRSYPDSPMLLVEYNRLSRYVTAQSAVWMELRRQAELANIEENKDMRSVTVLSPADPPVRPVSPRPIFDVVIGFCLGCLVSVMYLLARGQNRTVRP